MVVYDHWEGKKSRHGDTGCAERDGIRGWLGPCFSALLSGAAGRARTVDLVARNPVRMVMIGLQVIMAMRATLELGARN